MRIGERLGANIGKVAAARKLLTLVFYGLRDAWPKQREHQSRRSQARGRFVSDPLHWRGRPFLIDPAWLRPYHSMPPHAGGEGMTGNRPRFLPNRPFPTTGEHGHHNTHTRSRRDHSAPPGGRSQGQALRVNLRSSLDSDPSPAFVRTEPQKRRNPSQFPVQHGRHGPTPTGMTQKEAR